MRRRRGQSFEFGEQFALPLGEILRRFDSYLDIKVAGFARSQHGHAFVFQFELFARLGSFENLDLGFAVGEGMHGDFGAKRRLDHGNRNAAKEIGALALKKWMRLRRDENVEVAGWPPFRSRLALAAKTDPGSILDTWRNIDGKAALPGDAPGTAARLARIVDYFAAAVAMRTGAFNSKKALLRAHPPVSAAGRTMLWLGAGFGAGTRARVADDQGRQTDRCRFAVERL